MSFRRSILPLVAAATPLAAQEKITFQDHIRPIFENACSNCHNPDKKKGGLDLTSFVAAMAGGSSGEIAAAGAAAESRLFKSVARLEEPFMPPQGSPLGAKEIELIRKWIDGGVLETPTGVARKAKKPAFNMQVAGAATGKPEGPPPMPENLLLEPVVVTSRAQATGALTSSPWAPLVAISGQHQVLLYNTDTLDLAGILPFPDGVVESLQFSGNGQLIVAGGGRGGKLGKVVVWEVRTGRRVADLGDERDTVLGADITADQALVALGSPSRRIKIYETATGELVKDIKKHTDWVTAVRFSTDGVLLASGDRSGNVYVWESKSGNDFFTLAGHTSAITSLSWRADSNVLASSSEDGTIRLWEMNEGKEAKKWNAHGGGVLSMAFTHDGRLVSCGRDGQAKVWNQEGKQQAAQNKFSDLPLTTCFSHNGERFIVGDWSGKVSVWNSKDGEPVGDLSAAPPSIEQRLADARPKLESTQKDLAAAKDTLGTMTNNITAAGQQVDQGRKLLADFNARAPELERSLTTARDAAESLLKRLTSPAAPPPQTPPVIDAPTARALAEDLAAVTSRARSALGTLGKSVDGARHQLVFLPKELSGTRALIQSREAELAAMRQKAEEAQKVVDQAARALENHHRAVARWEAARINAAVIEKREELATLTTQLDDLNAGMAAAAKAIDDTTPQLAGAAEADKSKLEKALAEARQTLDRLQKEKPDLEARIAACKREIDENGAKYLSALPK